MFQLGRSWLLMSEIRWSVFSTGDPHKTLVGGNLRPVPVIPAKAGIQFVDKRKTSSLMLDPAVKPRDDRFGN